jgi:hypothetical protein
MRFPAEPFRRAIPVLMLPFRAIVLPGPSWLFDEPLTRIPVPPLPRVVTPSRSVPMKFAATTVPDAPLIMSIPSPKASRSTLPSV